MDSDREVDGSLAGFVARVVLLQTITYWVAGLVFFALFDYEQLFSTPPLATYMKPTDSVWIVAGPLFQPIRGAVMGLALWPFRRVFVSRDRGWLYLWGLFVGIAILNAPGPSPGSIEGFVYTTVPLSAHLRGLPEVLLQTLALSGGLVYWERHRDDRRLWWAFGALFVLVVSLSALGLLVESGML